MPVRSIRDGSTDSVGLIGLRRRVYPPAHASRACPTCAIVSAKPGQARVSWRGGSAVAAKLRWTGWGDYACFEQAAPPTPSPSPPLASLAGGGEQAECVAALSEFRKMAR